MLLYTFFSYFTIVYQTFVGTPRGKNSYVFIKKIWIKMWTQMRMKYLFKPYFIIDLVFDFKLIYDVDFYNFLSIDFK